MFIPQITPLVVLVALLGHHKFSVREAGYQRLAQIVDREKSYPVYPKAGLESKDHEVRTYSRRLDALWRDPLPPGTPYPRITFVPGQPARDEQMEVRHPRTGRFMNWVGRQDRYREECKEYAQSMLKSGARRYTVKRMLQEAWEAEAPILTYEALFDIQRGLEDTLGFRF